MSRPATFPKNVSLESIFPAESFHFKLSLENNENSIFCCHAGGDLRFDRVQRWRVKLEHKPWRRLEWNPDRNIHTGVAHINVYWNGGPTAVSGNGASFRRDFAGRYRLSDLEFFRLEYCQRECGRRGDWVSIWNCDHSGAVGFAEIQRLADSHCCCGQPVIDFYIADSIFYAGQYHPAIHGDWDL